MEAHQHKQAIALRLKLRVSGAPSTVGAVIISIGLLGCGVQSTGVASPMAPPRWAQPEAEAQAQAAPPRCGSGVTVEPLNTSGLSDRELANRITAYLNNHCLPLARASVTTKADGNREVLLYGFVASDLGKQDAEAKTAALLADSAIGVTDAIKVRPELLASQSQSAAVSGSADNANFEQANNLAEQNAIIQQYQNQNQSGLTSLLAPLLGLGIIGGGFGAGSGVFISPGGSWYPGLSPGFGYGLGLGPYYPSPMGPGTYLGTFPPFP